MSSNGTLKRYRGRGFFCAVLLVINSGSFAQDTPSELPETQIIRGPKDCFRTHSVRDYQFLDPQNLIVWAPNRRNAFHLELLSSCQYLRDAVGLAFQSRIGQFCGGAGDYVVAQDILPRRDEFEQRCMVRRVRALSEEDLYELTIEAGTIAPPPPIGPAEIEVLAPEAPDETPEADPSDSNNELE